MQTKVTVVSSKLAGIKEGPAVFRVTARDRSLWSFFRGNETVIQKNVTIDITPPALELIADDPYINFGGVGLVAYKTSSDAVTSGVKIGNYFFPGYKGQTKDPDTYIAFFAHPYNVAEDEKAVLVATDKAGNSRELRLAYTLKDVKYKKSTIPGVRRFHPRQSRAALERRRGAPGKSKGYFRQGESWSAQRKRRQDPNA